MQRASLPVAQLGTPWVSATPVGARRRGGGQMGASPPSPCFKFLSHVCWRKVGTCNYSCANPSLKMGRGREKKKKKGKKQKAPETDTVPLTLPKLGMCPTQGPPPPKKKKPSCFMRYLLIKTIKALILRKLSNSKMTYLLQWKKKS